MPINRKAAKLAVHAATTERREVMNVFYSRGYVASAYAFETMRKAKWIADAQVHDPDYVRAVQTGVPRRLAESQRFTWDAGLWPMGIRPGWRICGTASMSRGS
jgi:hypothetical protein